MPAASIFISYRRDDTAGYARAVYDVLAQHFGHQRVFIDVDDIAAGQAFDTAIAQAVVGSEVLLVLIGPRWPGLRDSQPPRLHDPGDFVHQEVAAGLARGMRVIPLLFDGAVMPGEAELPVPLRPLARRQALAIDASRFAADVERLVAVLREALGQPEAAPVLPVPPVQPALAALPAAAQATPAAGRRPWLLAALVAVLGAGGALLAWRSGPVAAPPLAKPAERAAVNGHWVAEVVYDWPNARYTEHFQFAGEATELHGSASFLRQERGIVDGRVEPYGLSFVTRTREQLGSDAAGLAATHRYRGRLVGDELHLVMQTEGGYSAHRPVEFVARRSAP